MIGKKKNLVVFGDRVWGLQKQKGISHEELSYKADLHKMHIGMIERAEKKFTLTNTEKTAKVLNVDIKDLY